MTKRLILIRHAKSSWEAPVGDHARPLNPRGRGACDALGQWLADGGYLPQSIYSSDAARTRETTTRIVSTLQRSTQTEPDIHFLDSLYHATPETLLGVLRKARGSCVALVAHNPGIAYFAEQIVSAPPRHDRFATYPTGATLVCDFPINDWADAVSRSAHAVDFVVPRDLSSE